MDWMSFIAGAGLGGIVGGLLQHFTVSRPLTMMIARMCYAGFMGDEPPTPPGVERQHVREE